MKSQIKSSSPDTLFISPIMLDNKHVFYDLLEIVVPDSFYPNENMIFREVCFNVPVTATHNIQCECSIDPDVDEDNVEDFLEKYTSLLQNDDEWESVIEENGYMWEFDDRYYASIAGHIDICLYKKT